MVTVALQNQLVMLPPCTDNAHSVEDFLISHLTCPAWSVRCWGCWQLCWQLWQGASLCAAHWNWLLGGLMCVSRKLAGTNSVSVTRCPGLWVCRHKMGACSTTGSSHYTTKTAYQTSHKKVLQETDGVEDKLKLMYNVTQSGSTNITSTYQ
jgi:hypothetical protein